LPPPRPQRTTPRPGPRDNVAKIQATTEYPSVQLGAEEGTGSDGCEWSTYVDDDLLQPIFQNGVDLYDDSSPIHIDDPTWYTSRLFSVTGRWFVSVGCDDGSRNGVYAEGDAVSIPDLIEAAYAELDPPIPASVSTSPIDNGGDRFPVVRIPTWFWIDDSYWSTSWTQRIEYPATAPRVWVEATATPDTTEWLPGDGSDWMACPGQGSEWRKGLGEDATDCAYTYLRASVTQPGDTYPLQGRVWLAVEWDTNVVGQATGPLAPIYRDSDPQPTRVGEILAVGS
jgi:hypothetical protein